MIIETPSLQFSRVRSEAVSRSDCFYVWARGPKPYVAQSFSALWKEVLRKSHKTSISTQFRRLDAGDCEYQRMSLQEVNQLISGRGCFVVTGEPECWQVDMSSLVGHEDALEA